MQQIFVITVERKSVPLFTVNHNWCLCMVNLTLELLSYRDQRSEYNFISSDLCFHDHMVLNLPTE